MGSQSSCTPEQARGFVVIDLEYVRIGSFDEDTVRKDLYYVLRCNYSDEVNGLAKQGLSYFGQCGSVSEDNIPRLIEVLEGLEKLLPQ